MQAAAVVIDEQSSLVLKCDLHERLIDPHSLPCHSYFVSIQLDVQCELGIASILQFLLAHCCCWLCREQYCKFSNRLPLFTFNKPSAGLCHQTKISGRQISSCSLSVCLPACLSVCLSCFNYCISVYNLVLLTVISA